MENLIVKPMQPMTESELENYTLHRRFDRMGRLIGDARMQKLMNSHVMVIGMGGVGSWAAESIVRSGVGKVTLVDFDEVCVTNANRQLHALVHQVGKQKAEVMAERLRGINPKAEITPILKFYNEDHEHEVFAERPDFVIDAIDHITSKCHLITKCRREGIPMVTSTGSGGKMDPGQIKVTDLAFTTVDPLAQDLRRILRAKYDFPKDLKEAFGVPAIYSAEPFRMPEELKYDNGKGFRCVCPQKDNEYYTCDNRNLILGSASFVTGAFGLHAASVAVRSLLGEFTP